MSNNASNNKYKDYLSYEKKVYFSCFKEKLLALLLRNERYYYWKYLFYLRKEEKHLLKKSLFSKIFVFIYRRKRNHLGNRFGIKIVPLLTERGINIHHRNVIINARIGRDCVFHGDNCLGNNTMSGLSESVLPTVGDNVDFGYGSTAFGDITICSNVKIGAGAVVVKSISEENSIWAGVPAKRIDKKK